MFDTFVGRMCNYSLSRQYLISFNFYFIFDYVFNILTNGYIILVLKKFIRRKVVCRGSVSHRPRTRWVTTLLTYRVAQIANDIIYY